MILPWEEGFLEEALGVDRRDGFCRMSALNDEVFVVAL